MPGEYRPVRAVFCRISNRLAGEQVDVAKPTMSAHFAVLVAADLIEADKSGCSITYRLKMSVLEEALLAFAQTVGLHLKVSQRAPALVKAQTRR